VRILGRIKENFRGFFRSLGFKIGLGVGVILLTSYCFFIYRIVEIQQDFYLRQKVRESDRLSRTVINATNNSMLEDDPESTRRIISEIAGMESISDIRIYNHDGVIKFSNQQGEVGTKVHTKAEACFACHSEEKPFSQVVSDKRTRVHQRSDYRILGMITPIYNKESCYTASCHVHPKEQRILGVLDLGMSLKSFDSHQRSMIISILVLGCGTFFAVVATIGMYMAVRVHRPLSRLRDASRKIAAGDFTYPLPAETNDQLGEFVKTFKIMREQTRRRTLELVKSRSEYKSLFEQVPCFICVIDRDFEIIRQNSLMRDLFKGSIGSRCYEAFKKRSTKCEDCHMDKAFSEGRPCARKHCGLTVTGEEANYVSYAAPVQDDRGRISYGMIIAVDIGDRVKLERELAVSKDFQTNLIDNSIHGIIATDANGRVAIYNRAAEALMGYPAGEVIGDAELQKYFPDRFVRMVVDSHMGKEIEDYKLVAQEAFINSWDGEAIPIRFSGVVLFDKDRTIGSVGFFQDLRIFKKLEREKLASDRLAVVGQTVAGLAHGIKNILQGLEGGVYVVETAITDKDQSLLEKGWGMVQKNIARISGLVQDLLSYSKQRIPQYEATDPNLLAEEVCALFEQRAQDKGIVIERQFDDSLSKDVKIFLDQRGIHTCLSNLLANSVDACEIDKKDVQHKIIVSTKKDNDNEIIFVVADNGAGMSEETKAKIFSSFYSTKGSRGTGLGLLVTSKIVSEHGGEMSFDSEPGVGTTFVIKLPFRGLGFTASKEMESQPEKAAT
jgi:histidine kinase